MNQTKNTFFQEFEEESGSLTLYYAKQSDIDSLVFPPNTKELMILGDYIDKLIIPDGVTYVSADRIGLKEIYVPDSVKYLYLSDNFLTQLELPSGIEKVEANLNYLEHVRFRGQPDQLFSLELEDNRLEDIDFNPPKTLEVFNVKKNRFQNFRPKIAKIINQLLHGHC